MVGLIIVISVLTLIVSYAWAKALSDMKENHPDYKGGDFLNWDDNKVHTEDNF